MLKRKEQGPRKPLKPNRVSFQYGVGSGGGICEPITIPMCQGLSYNQTMSPNLLGHASQREAVAKMSFFNAMVQTMCTVDIRLFVCAVYVPPCLVGEVQRPCRSFCERARRGCGAFMASFDVSWPAELQCDSFPVDKCVSVSNGKEVADSSMQEVIRLLSAHRSLREIIFFLFHRKTAGLT